MWPGMVGPDELKLLQGVLDKASAQLRVMPGSEEHEDLASLILALYQAVKDPDELLTITLRGTRYGGASVAVSPPSDEGVSG